MLVKRFKNNPLITPADIKPSRDDWEVVGVFNPAAVKFGNQILLLLRIAERPKEKKADEQIAPILNPQTAAVEYFKVKNNDTNVEIPDSRSFYYKGQMFLTSISHLRIARSTDGSNFTVDEKPAVFPEKHYETYGLEDARITNINNEFFITYKAVSKAGICTALLKTTDFINFQRQGIIFCPENIDVVIFPEKINGKFIALTRPVPRYIGPRAIWIADSPDAVHWGNHRPLLFPRQGMFDGGKVGASCVPIKTADGWLEIYHGSDENDRYSLAAALLDLKDPAKVIARSKTPLMQPKADYELAGFYGNVVFACGAIEHNAGQIDIYYGASDEYTAAAATSIENIMKTFG